MPNHEFVQLQNLVNLNENLSAGINCILHHKQQKCGPEEIQQKEI